MLDHTTTELLIPAVGSPRPSIRDLAAQLCILVSCLVLAGWALDIGLFKSLLSGLVTMKANTALAILAAGCGLLLLPSRPARPGDDSGLSTAGAGLAGACGALALALGGLTLFEYGTGLSLGIDELLVNDPNTTSPPYPGRMTLITALGLACVGAAVMIIAANARRGRPPATRAILVAHALATVPACVGYLSFVGYAYDVARLHRFGSFAAVALNTAGMLLLLAAAVVLTLPSLGWRRGFETRPVARTLFMRLLPVTLLVPFAAGGAVVWGARQTFYEPLYGPALFAVIMAASALGMAWYAAAAVRAAEGTLAQTTAALRESVARFRTITDALPQMVWSTRADGFADYFNQRWFTLTGTTPVQVMGAGSRDLLHPDDRDHAWGEWQRCLATGDAYETEFRLRMADGGFRWMLGRALPMLDANGGVSRWFGTCTDIEEKMVARDAQARSRLELERLVGERTRDLEDAQARLVHVQRMEALGQLAGGIAHDFNNVLQAVQSGAALLERRNDDPEGVQRLAGMVLAAAGRGHAITRRLLAFSRRGELRAEAIDPAQVLSDLRDILIHTLGTRIEIRTAAAAPLPRMLADLSQLETVMINLATNARDAMPNGGRLTLDAASEHIGTPEAMQGVVALKPGGYVRLSIADTGCGMDAATLARACEPFYTTKALGEGTGLGLALARGFVEQSGGAMHIASVPDRGTIVTLWLPVTQATPPVAVAPHGPATPVDTALGRLLLVDDEAMVRDILSEEMEAAGYTVTSAPSGAAALAVLDSGERIDLLVTDLSMPGMDGLTLVREAQLRRPRLPAILLTGHATTAAEIAVGEAVSGTLSMLRKPIRGKHLADRVAAQLAAVAMDDADGSAVLEGSGALPHAPTEERHPLHSWNQG